MHGRWRQQRPSVLLATIPAEMNFVVRATDATSFALAEDGARVGMPRHTQSAREKYPRDPRQNRLGRSGVPSVGTHAAPELPADRADTMTDDPPGLSNRPMFISGFSSIVGSGFFGIFAPRTTHNLCTHAMHFRLCPCKVASGPMTLRGRADQRSSAQSEQFMAEFQEARQHLAWWASGYGHTLSFAERSEERVLAAVCVRCGRGVQISLDLGIFDRTEAAASLREHCSPPPPLVPREQRHSER